MLSNLGYVRDVTIEFGCIFLNCFICFGGLLFSFSPYHRTSLSPWGEAEESPEDHSRPCLFPSPSHPVPCRWHSCPPWYHGWPLQSTLISQTDSCQSNVWAALWHGEALIDSGYVCERVFVCLCSSTMCFFNIRVVQTHWLKYWCRVHYWSSYWFNIWERFVEVKVLSCLSLTLLCTVIIDKELLNWTGCIWSIN